MPTARYFSFKTVQNINMFKMFEWNYWNYYFQIDHIFLLSIN